MNLTNLTLYGECPEYTYYRHSEGYKIQYNKANKTYEKMVSRYDSNGKLTGTKWELIQG